MNALHRRLLRLEAVGGQRVLTHLSDDELGDRLRAELRLWLAEDPQACPADARSDVAAFLAANDDAERTP